MSLALVAILFTNIAQVCHCFDLTMSSVGNTAKKAQFVTNKMCPFAQKAWIALETSKTPFTMEEISLYGANGKPSWFLKLNPAGTVPVLNIDDGATVIPDSELILEYISREDNEMTRSYDRNDAQLTLKIKAWRKNVSEKIIPIGKRAVLGGSTEPLNKLLAELDENVEGPFLCGDSITAADCCAFPFIWRIDQEFGVDGKIKEWLDVCEKEDAFKKTIQRSWWWWW